MMKLIARKGERVTRADSGRVVAIVKSPIATGGTISVKDFDWLIDPPKAGEGICSYGPDPYVRKVAEFGVRICVEGEWRPKSAFLDAVQSKTGSDNRWVIPLQEALTRAFAKRA